MLATAWQQVNLILYLINICYVFIRTHRSDVTSPMTTPAALSDIWPRYCSNLPRHVARVTRHTELQVMNYLTDCGYSRLAMNFAQPLSALSLNEMRPSDLARHMGVSKQLCAQSLRPIYNEGYITQRPDPDDRRGRLITLTERGRALVDDAMNELVRINRQYNKVLGTERNKTLGANIVASFGKQSAASGINHWSATNIGFLSRRMYSQLLQILAAKGHSALQSSFHQVLFNIDLRGTTVAELARYNAVTGQAISRIARELEALGYITRRDSVRDKRSRELHLAPRGLQFVRDAVAAIDMVTDELSRSIGNKATLDMCCTIGQLYESMETDQLLNAHLTASEQQLMLPADKAGEITIDTADLLLYLATLLHDRDRLLTPLRSQPRAPVRASDSLIRTLQKKVIEPELIDAALARTLGAKQLAQLKNLLSAEALSAARKI